MFFFFFFCRWLAGVSTTHRQRKPQCIKQKKILFTTDGPIEQNPRHSLCRVPLCEDWILTKLAIIAAVNSTRHSMPAAKTTSSTELIGTTANESGVGQHTPTTTQINQRLQHHGSKLNARRPTTSTKAEGSCIPSRTMLGTALMVALRTSVLGRAHGTGCPRATMGKKQWLLSLTKTWVKKTKHTGKGRGPYVFEDYCVGLCFML